MFGLWIQQPNDYRIHIFVIYILARKDLFKWITIVTVHFKFLQTNLCSTRRTWYNNIPICFRDSVRQVKWFNLLWVVTVFCACFMSISVFLSVLILYYSIILLLFYIILYTIILIFVWRIRLLKVHAFIVLEWIYFLS